LKSTAIRVTGSQRCVSLGLVTTGQLAHDVVVVQRRTMSSLVVSQALGGVGVATGMAVSALLAEQILGSADLAGLAGTSQVLGAAVAAYVIATLSGRRGRRMGLSVGYLMGATGALLAVLAATVSSFPMLLAGNALLGSATAAGSQARFAATDLAAPDDSARSLSTVVWATTIGAVLGPNLVGVAGDAAVAAALPRYAGAYLLGALGTGAAGIYLLVRLRPDPLLLSRSMLSAPPPGAVAAPIRRVREVVRAHPHVLAGIVVVACAHATMVAVMGMTPLHMDHGGASLQVVGLVLSVHILGMFAFSPLVGRATDRFGRRAVIGVGALMLLAAVALAGTAHEGHSAGLTAGLFLLGLGWSLALVAGSTLVGAGLGPHERPRVQGAADMVMGVSAAAAGALSGVVVGAWGYGTLNAAAGVLALVVLAVALAPARASV
jgi:MFS family permease